MTYSDEQLRQIYDRSSGYCHLCHKKLAFSNYGKPNSRAAWEVEHSNAQANGGTNRLNNLFPACISCNRSKGVSSTKVARAKNGKSRAPLSLQKRKKAKVVNAFAGGAAFAVVGSVFGPAGFYLGALIGANIGYQLNPDK